MSEQKVVEQEKVIARFLYTKGVPVVRIFKTKKDAEWAAHMEGDHLVKMEILN